MRTWITAVAALTVVAVTSASARAQDLSPEIIYHHGKMVTGNASFDIVEAVAIKDGKVTAVGTNQAVRKLASSRTRLVDLGGRTVLPGFNDNHVHLAAEELEDWHGGLIGAQTPWLAGATTVAALVAALKKHAVEVPKGEWIEASISREEWSNSTIPDKWDLDKAAPDHPVVINRGPHTMILNSLALEKAHITNDTAQPRAGGWFFKNDRGELNGRVLESARRLVNEVMPPRKRLTDDQMIEAYRRRLAAIRGPEALSGFGPNRYADASIGEGC